MADDINYTGNLPRYVFDRLFDNLTDQSYWNVDDPNNVDLLRLIARGSNSKFQPTIRVIFDRVCDVGDWEKLQNSWKCSRHNTNCDINGE